MLPYAGRLTLTERAALLDDYAWELHIAHRFSDAVQAGREAIVLREQAGDPAALAETLLRVSRHLYMAGDTEGAGPRSNALPGSPSRSSRRRCARPPRRTGA